MTTAPTPSPAQAPRFPRLNWTLLLLTSLGIAIYFPQQYSHGSLAALGHGGVGLASTYADRPSFVQVAFYAHISFAGLALLVGPFQFSKTIRYRFLRLHRALGRVYIVSCLVGGSAAFVMAFYSSVALVGLFGFGSLAVLWVLFTGKAYRAIRRHDIASHQAWMMRSFALTYAAPTLRLWLGLLLVSQVLLLDTPPAQAFPIAYAPVAFLCWLPNIVIVEFMIRRRGLPSLQLTPSPTAERRPSPAAPAE